MPWDKSAWFQRIETLNNGYKGKPILSKVQGEMAMNFAKICVRLSYQIKFKKHAAHAAKGANVIE